MNAGVVEGEQLAVLCVQDGDRWERVGTEGVSEADTVSGRAMCN